MAERTAEQVDSEPEDWRGRATAAEARVAELEAQLRVVRVVVAAFDAG